MLNSLVSIKFQLFIKTIKLMNFAFRLSDVGNLLSSFQMLYMYLSCSLTFVDILTFMTMINFMLS